jgi:hypothetical protein
MMVTVRRDTRRLGDTSHPSPKDTLAWWKVGWKDSGERDRVEKYTGSKLIMAGALRPSRNC